MRVPIPPPTSISPIQALQTPIWPDADRTGDNMGMTTWTTNLGGTIYRGTANVESWHALLYEWKGLRDDGWYDSSNWTLRGAYENVSLSELLERLESYLVCNTL